MQRALLIAEKPDLMRKVESAYNSHRGDFSFSIDFAAQRGHLFALMRPHELDESMKQWKWEQLPFYPEEHGGWKYKIPQEKKQGNFPTSAERYKDIKAKYDNGNYDFIIHCGDPDREGELLVWETITALRAKIPVKRFWSNDVTEGAILKALHNLRDEATDEFLINLRREGYGRQHADYIMGMNLSQAGSLAMNGRVSLGRVKTPILSIVCKRELDILNFKPSTSYGVRVNYTEGFTGQYFIKAEKVNSGEDGSERDEKDEESGLIYFDTRKEAEDFAKTLGSEFIVESFETKMTKTSAPKLFKLATAQIEAGKAGYSADRTLEIIQSLYEKAYISYPRTDCECISSSEDLEALIKSASCVLNVNEYGHFMPLINSAAIKKVLGTKKYVNDKELESHGHSALIPTTNKPNLDILTKDERFIYEMIAKRFIAIFLPPIVQNKTVLITSNNGNTFKSNGKTLVDPGFSELFGTKFTDMEIPVHDKGDILLIDGYDIPEKTTKCPSRFTSSDLVAVCENPKKYLDDENLKKTLKEFHIGTPATRASIIKGLHQYDGYLQEKKEGKKVYLIPTDNGMKIYQNLKTTMICKVDMTADWDMLLEQVGQGSLSLNDFENKIKSDNEALITEFKNTKMQALSGYSVVGDCPKCSSPVLSAKKGFFCSGWKKDGTGCDFTVYGFVCETKITDADFSALLAGAHITKKIKNKGKSWEQEMVLNPEEHKIEWVNANADFESENTGLQCPICGKEVITTPYGFKCENYSKDGDGCKFSIGEMLGVKLTLNDVADLIVNKKTRLIDGFTSKKGKKFAAYVILDENKEISFDFPDENDALTPNAKISTCPKCGAEMINTKWDYHCTNEACSVKLSKFICKKWLTDAELERIFTKGKSPLIKGLQGKQKKFDAYLKWDGADRYEFEFPQKRRK